MPLSDRDRRPGCRLNGGVGQTVTESGQPGDHASAVGTLRAGKGSGSATVQDVLQEGEIHPCLE
jgi:hypothetical protein